MQATGAPKKRKGPIVDPAVCRACRSIKKCRLLTTEYDWMGQKEVYSHMFVDVFGLVLSHLDGDYKESCICATCVLRLRDACAFRQQVLLSEETFLACKLGEDGNIELKVEVKTEHLQDIPSEEDLLRPDSRGSLNAEDIAMDMSDIVLDEMTNIEPEAPPGETAGEAGEQDLETKVLMMHEKLEKMLDKPGKPKTKKVPKQVNQIEAKSKKKQVDEDNMAYENAVVIVTNSFVCPFHNRISNYYCFYCKDQFTSPTELREHTLQHNPVLIFEDTVENKRIPKIDITRIDCRLCDAKIDDLNTFKTHITSVHGKQLHPVSNEFLKFKLTEENLACTECGKTFPYFDSLKKHMIDHFGTLVCDICGACFLERNSLRTHIKSHSRVTTNFPCEICGKNLKSKYSRGLHVATVHEKKPTVNCYKCEDSFMSYALRNRHLIEVHGDKRTFPCKLCDKVYNRRKTLMEHNRRNHLKVLRHQCPFCDQKFYLPSRLREHLASHTGERTYRCQICNKAYPRLQSLQDHFRVHNTEKKFRCHLCTSAFSQSVSWKNHLKNHHPGYVSEAGYAC